MPGGVILKVENLWLCPHIAIGSQLEVQARMLTSWDPCANWVLRAEIGRLNSLTPLFLARWHIICVVNLFSVFLSTSY